MHRNLAVVVIMLNSPTKLLGDVSRARFQSRFFLFSSSSQGLRWFLSLDYHVIDVGPLLPIFSRDAS